MAVVILAVGGCGVTEGSPTTEASSASPGRCGGTEVRLSDLMALSPEERLECFDGRSITFGAYVSGMVGAGTCTFSPIPGGGWLNLCGGPSRILVVNPGDEEGLKAYLPPTLDPEDIPIDTWITATGHFDDPAAATCDREEPAGPAHDPEQAQMCRLAFVLETAAPAP